MLHDNNVVANQNLFNDLLKVKTNLFNQHALQVVMYYYDCKAMKMIMIVNITAQPDLAVIVCNSF